MRSHLLTARNKVKNGFVQSCKRDPKYADPEITYENAISHHSPLRLFNSVEQAVLELDQPRDSSKSSNILFLATANNPLDCKFRLFESPKAVEALEEELTKNYEVSDFDDNSPVASWQTVQVPSVWQLHPNKMVSDFNSSEKTSNLDNDDPPIYTNMAYPWKTKNNSSTTVPIENNPVGVYRLQFTVPAEWLENKKLRNNRQLRLLFHGGGSGLSIYVNSTYLGYGQDSMTETEVLVPHESVLVDTPNVITVFCHKYTDGSYLEDQDQWWFAGLFRDIELQFLPSFPATVFDYKVTTLTPHQLSNLNNSPTKNATITTSLLLFSELFDADTNVEVERNIETLPIQEENENEGIERKRAKTKVGSAIIFDDIKTKEKSLSIINYRQSMSVDMPVAADIVSEKPLSLLVYVFSQNKTRVAVKLVHFDFDEEILVNTTTPHQKRLQVSVEVPDAKLWNVETPYLYTVVYELRHRTEEENYLLQCEALKVGIRSVDIFNGQVRVNCKPILVCGVNRHEFCPEKGKVMTEELLQNDLRLIKNLNFNAIRCSHYPNVHRFYELCNEHGLFVVDEANVETHGMALAQGMSLLQLDKRFQRQIQKRIKSMYLRAKNYSCVIGWSLGNEAGSAAHLRSVVEWLRTEEQYFENNLHVLQRGQEQSNELYRGRFIQYEGGIASGDTPLLAGDGQDPNLTDIVCPMYFTPRELLITLRKDNKRVKALKAKLSAPNLDKWKQEITKIQKAKFRPFILCEYSHAMGNSNGNLHLYWNLFKSSTYPQLQGGFIWDFVDQGLSLVNPAIDFTQIYPQLNGKGENGSHKFGYGGSFGDNSGAQDANFCINGLVLPNRELKPGAKEAKYLQQPLDFLLEIVLGEKPCFFLTALVHTHCVALHTLSFEWRLFDATQTLPIATENFYYRKKKNQKSVTFGLTKAFIAYKTALLKYREEGKSDHFALEIVAKVVTDTVSYASGHVLAQELINLEKVVPEERLLETEKIVVKEVTPEKQEIKYDLNAEEGCYQVETLDYFAQFDHENGVLLSMSTNQNIPIIEKERAGIDYCFYRAPLDNDNGGPDTLLNSFFVKWAAKWTKMQALSTPWKKLNLANISAQTLSVDIEEEESFLRFQVKQKHSSNNSTRFLTTTDYVFLPKKLSIKFKVEADKSITALPSVPRVGVTFQLPGVFNFCNYLGRGPHENYADRKSSTGHRVHSNRVKEWNVPYLKPCESGGRSDVKWIEFTNEESSLAPPVFRITYMDDLDNAATQLSREEVFPGLTKRELSVNDQQRIREEDANQPTEGFKKLFKPVKEDVAFRGKADARPAGADGCHFSISSYSVAELASARHDFDLPEVKDEDSVYVHLDTAHMGVGGDTSWFPYLHQQYRVKGKSWEWQLDFEPIKQDLSFFASLRNNLRDLYRSSFVRNSRNSGTMSEVTGMGVGRNRGMSRATTRTRY